MAAISQNSVILRKEFGSIGPFKASVVRQFTANDTSALIRKRHLQIY